MRFGIALLLLAVNAPPPHEVRVFAAASLAEALQQIGADYERATGQHVVFNFAGSQTLARQIAHGALADVFLSADAAQVQAVGAKDAVRLLSNRLVIVVPAASTRNVQPDDLPRLRSLALGDPASVPAGVYARRYLERRGLWTRVAPHVVPAESVRGALAAVASGNADAAIVYRTDARVSPRVRVTYEVPREETPEIAYAFASLTSGGAEFLRYVGTDGALRVFAGYGFEAIPGVIGSSPRNSEELRGTHILSLTLRTAALATLLIVPPGLAIAWLLARRRWRGKSLVETLVALPLVLPPVATGLLLLELLGWLRRGTGLELAFTWRAVVAAMMVMSFPLLVRAARVAFEEVDPRLEQIARTLGAHDGRVFVTITLPLAARGIVSGMLLAFARAVGEFGATILVAGNIPGRTRTLSLAIYDLVQLGRDAEAFRLVGIAALIAFAAVFTAEALLRKAARER
ncbi:MAG TPA: molybdate ABC transporter permease subunit [Thermoanaerobaculia bacterium]